MPVKHTNRKGQTYFLHRGVRKDGKTHYYFSTRRASAKLVEKMPEGHELFEKPRTGQVFIRKRVISTIDESEWELAEKLVSECSDLPDYAVILERTGKEIIVHEAANAQDILAAHTKSMESRQTGANVIRYDFGGAVAGADGEHDLLGDALNKVLAARAMFMNDPASFLTTRESVIRREFWPAFRFELTKGKKASKQAKRSFTGYRFNYSSENWRYISEGTLEKLLRQFLPHLGKESFFEMDFL